MSSYILRLPQRGRRFLKTATHMIVLVATITVTMAVGGTAVASAS
jgi:TRAP-type C4-dicarboxylate transport system permease small subunit